MKDNIILMSDAYKYTHHLQYPKGIRHVYSYMESRGVSNSALSKDTVFFGLQYYLKRYLSGPVVTHADIDQAESVLRDVFGHGNYFNRAGWERIVNVHGGMLPVEIRAVPEGLVVPTGNVLLTIVNTDPELPWLTNFIETLLMKLWYPISVASMDNDIYRTIDRWAQKTGGSVSPFHMNDFGYRGVSSEESAKIGGASHLLSFRGTDTIGGIRLASEYYGLDDEDTYGHSVMASEHSTTTIYGPEGEYDAFRKFIKISGSGAIISLVADSYDYEEALMAFAGELRQDVLNHGKTGGRVVVRPDSGDPIEMTMVGLETLAYGNGDNIPGFGVEMNEKGFKVLPSCIGIIYGDGINLLKDNSIERICKQMYNEGWAVDGRNVVFGMGGGLLQSTDKDTYKFAIKCSAAMGSDGQWFDVYKNPATMSSKASKRGKLILTQDLNTKEFKTIQGEEGGLLDVVFRNGEILRTQTFSNIRETLNRSR